jgi:acetyl-CoA acetyltransferase
VTTGAVISGVGLAGPHRHQELPGHALAAIAVQHALTDAGLDRADVDGLVVNIGGPAGPDYDQLARFAGLDAVQTSYQTWAHGRFTASSVQLGRMLVESGLARHVACVYGYHLQTGTIGGEGWRGWVEENRIGGGPHHEEPGLGLTAPAGTMAMAVRAYCERYHVDPAELYRVCRDLRANASKNPDAFYRRPLDRGQYEAAPVFIDPLRVMDSTPVTEGGAAIIVSAPAVSDPTRSVRIRGFQGVPAGSEEFIWARRGIGVFGQTETLPYEPAPIFERSGVARKDVDLFYTYDAFSPLVWFGLERFGYCGYGEAPAYVADVGLGLDSALPVNSHGGMLNAGHLSGWGHLVEAVTQLRGEAQDRQVAGAAIAHWGATFGESMILAVPHA